MAEIIEPNKTEENPITEDVLNKALENLSGIPVDMQGMESIIGVIALPDEQFNLLSGVILNELEKSLNNPEDKLMLVSSLNASGYKADDLISIFEEVTKEIDEQLTGKLPQDRIDFLKQIMGMTVNAISQTEGIAKRVISVPIELCNEDAVKPTYAHSGDAGMDVYSPADYTINPGETVIIPLGFKVAIPLGYELQVRPRSGMSVKTKMRVANSPGTIDSNYRDEVGVIVENIEPSIKDIEIEWNLGEDGKPVGTVRSALYGSNYTISKGDRFAQIVLAEVPTANFYEVEDVKEIGYDRAGGFGSTGK